MDGLERHVKEREEEVLEGSKGGYRRRNRDVSYALFIYWDTLA